MNDLDISDRNEATNRDPQGSHAVERNAVDRQQHRRRRRWGGRLVALGGCLLLVGGVSLGASGQYSQQQQVMETAEQERDFVPSVRVATIGASPATTSVNLPGTTAAFAAANIYARATGYIAKRNVDIGDRVTAGGLLAQLAVPELDDQILQNEATLDQLKSALEQAEASRKLAEMTWGRDEPLVKKGWVTPQQGDVDLQTLKAREAAVAVAQHNVAAQESLVKQLHQNRDYAAVVAPFDGVITQRNVDLGSLVQATPRAARSCSRSCRRTSSASGSMPQDAAFGVAPGIDAVVRVPELPDREFPAPSRGWRMRCRAVRGRC